MGMNIRIGDFYLPDLEVEVNLDKELADLSKNAMVDAIALYSNKQIGWWSDFTKNEIEDWVNYIVETAFDLGRVAIIQQLIEQNYNKYSRE